MLKFEEAGRSASQPIQKEELRELMQVLNASETITVADVAETLNLPPEQIAQALRDVRLRKSGTMVRKRRREKSVALGLALTVLAWIGIMNIPFSPSSVINPPVRLEYLTGSVPVGNTTDSSNKVIAAVLEYRPSTLWSFVVGPRVMGGEATVDYGNGPVNADWTRFRWSGIDRDGPLRLLVTYRIDGERPQTIRQPLVIDGVPVDLNLKIPPKRKPDPVK